ncbi:hypothetical protein Zm00014a_018896 [Zea mays]|uniref:Uncharacterized protein n=1 Tax=Zea mays TaxID=4577 RepID=A0A317YHA2_MAIZE|nr:hypothetical protein Zm00014a_018896 [Zea mays]
MSPYLFALVMDEAAKDIQGNMRAPRGGGGE